MRKFLTDEVFKKEVKILGYELLKIDRENLPRPKLVIRDKSGYKFYYYYSNLKRYKPSIAEPNNPFSVENIELWLKLNNSNFRTRKDTIYTKAREPLKLYCLVCKNNITSNWNSLYSGGQGCGICSGRHVSDKNRLSIKNKKLSKEWDYEENYPLTPDDVSCGSDKPANWICAECEYKWKTNTISERNRGNGCPRCAGFVLTDENRFTLVFPESAKEWNYKKNENLKPEDFSFGSNKKVWWFCSKCKKREWFASIASRRNKVGCKKCSGIERLTIEYCSETAKKEGYILTTKKYKNAHEKMIFIHEYCGSDFIVDWHHFQSGQRCLECSLKNRESKIATHLKKYCKEKYNAETESKKVKNPKTGHYLKYDIFIPSEINIFIEVHGGQHYNFTPHWHKILENFKYSKYKDKIKKKYAKENGIYLEIDLRKKEKLNDIAMEIDKYFEMSKGL